jgi:AhpD family alkylhydroperoxidase
MELIGITVGAALKCPHCTGYHMQAAVRMGATREEVLEVILIAGMISNSSVLANAYRIFNEKVEKCVPCEVEEEPEEKPARAAGKKTAAKKRRKR